MSNSFSQCVSNICGLELATLVNDYKYSVFGSHTVVVEGHKGIVDYKTDCIVFSVKGCSLHIVGKGLRIKCLERNFAVVVGEILSVGVSDEK